MQKRHCSKKKNSYRVGDKHTFDEKSTFICIRKRANLVKSFNNKHLQIHGMQTDSFILAVLSVSKNTKAYHACKIPSLHLKNPNTKICNSHLF